MRDPVFNRRQVLKRGGLAAGAVLLPRGQRSDSSVAHLMSFIGEYAPDGAYVCSVVDGDTPVDLAVATSPNAHGGMLVGAQRPDADHLVRHDLAGLLAPGTQYYAWLLADGRTFGRMLSFRTRVADADPANLLIALVSCQCQAGLADPAQPGWRRLLDVAPDLLLHLGDYGYWGGRLSRRDPYQAHLDRYVEHTTNLTQMRAVMESTSSLVQVSDHETSKYNLDNYHDPITQHALEAYFRLMPFRSFDDPTRRSRFLTRRLSTNVRLIAPDFRSLDRSPGAWPDDASKTAYGEFQFELLRSALKAPEPLKILLSDPGCSPADAPADPGARRTLDKWCNYQTAFQQMADVVRHERTVVGGPIVVDIWSGDRHVLGSLSETHNHWGPFDVLTASGMDQIALPLEPGEQYDQLFGEKTERHQRVKQHMEVQLTDDKAGTITRVARGIDDVTGTQVVYSTKSWSYAPIQTSVREGIRTRMTSPASATTQPVPR